MIPGKQNSECNCLYTRADIFSHVIIMQSMIKKQSILSLFCNLFWSLHFLNEVRVTQNTVIVDNHELPTFNHFSPLFIGALVNTVRLWTERWNACVAMSVHRQQPNWKRTLAC